MSNAILTALDGLWRLCKVAFEVLVLDLLASFLDGYRNARWRYQERFAEREWSR